MRPTSRIGGLGDALRRRSRRVRTRRRRCRALGPLSSLPEPPEPSEHATNASTKPSAIGRGPAWDPPAPDLPADRQARPWPCVAGSPGFCSGLAGTDEVARSLAPRLSVMRNMTHLPEQEADRSSRRFGLLRHRWRRPGRDRRGGAGSLDCFHSGQGMATMVMRNGIQTGVSSQVANLPLPDLMQ